MIRPSTLVATVAAVFAAATPGLAQELLRHPPVARSASIDLGRFDLTTDAGADALIARIEATARRLCAGGPSGGALEQQAALRAAECRRNAVAGALAKLDAPVVQQRYAARRDHPIRLAGR